MVELFTKENVVNKLTELSVFSNYVYRGYSYETQLLPALIRNDKVNKEILLLHEFERYSSIYYRANNPMDFLACAQHYGLSTRLLDFTYNPFIALFFSIYNEKDKSKCKSDDEKDFYYISYCNTDNNILIKDLPIFDKMYLYEIKSNTQYCRYIIDTINKMFDKKYPFGPEGGTINSNDIAIRAFFQAIATRTDGVNIEEYVSESKKKVEAEKILFMDNNRSNQRLLMQQGLFMFPYNLNADEHLKILRENTETIKVHHSIRIELLDYLNTIGINTFKLMPDLSSVCSEIERKIK